MADLQPRAVHLGVASLNQTVGDWEGNAGRILEVVHAARHRGVRLLFLPEACIPGYSLGDRLPRRGTLERSWQALLRIAPATRGMVVALGLPVRHRGILFNAMAVVADGRIRALVAKENLATGDVEYESRWYQAWPHGLVEPHDCPDGTTIPMGSQVFEADGIGRFGIEICEDGWRGVRPASSYALAGAEIVGNPSASWFMVGKHAIRRQLVAQVSREDHLVYAYCSLLGCDATRLVFDGSLLVAANGEPLAEGPRLVLHRDVVLVDVVVDMEAVRQPRREKGAWRDLALRQLQGSLGPRPPTLRLPGRYPTATPPPARPPYWLPPPPAHPDPSLAWLEERELVPPMRPEDVPFLELELALAIGMRDYLRKSGVGGVAVALSGGRDSAMVALLVHRMLRLERPDAPVEKLAEETRRRLATAYLATRNSSAETAAAARELAEELGARHHELDVQPAVEAQAALAAALKGARLDWSNPLDDLALQNLQARVRATTIWALANLEGRLLLTTSNKSEAAVGYTTMDGDTAGGFAPIADVPKSLVEAWLRWARERHGYRSLDAVLARPPSAELRPPERAQTDEGDLMPFEVLDRLTWEFVRMGRDPLDCFEVLWPEMAPRYGGDPRAFARDIRRFVVRLCAAQWKRERLAISLRVTAFDLDPKSGFRFPPIQAPFTEELEALDAHVERLIDPRDG